MLGLTPAVVFKVVDTRESHEGASEDPNPKTRMLGPTPSIFCRVDVSKTWKQVFGDPQNICIWGRSEKRQTKKYHLFERYKKRRESEKSKTNDIKSVSEQADKKKVIKKSSRSLYVGSSRDHPGKVMKTSLCRQKREAPHHPLRCPRDCSWAHCQLWPQ